MALAGRDAVDTQSMFGNVMQGLKHVKRAVSRDMNNPELRLLRAYMMFNLPEVFFHMSEKTAKDFRFLASAYERDDDIFEKETYCKVLYDLGVCYERLGDAERAGKVWKKLLAVCPDTKYKSLLSKKLEGSGIE